jgi:ketosteroid isomerase-like protein
VTSDSNRALVTSMYEAAKRGDLDTFVAALSPDVVVIEPAFLPYGGTYRGVEAFLSLFADLAATFHIAGLNVDRIIADGDVVLGFLRMPLANQESVLGVIEQSTLRDGKVTEMRIFVHDLGALRPRWPRAG